MIGKADLQQSISPQKNSKKAAPNWSWTISRTLPWLAEQSNRGVLLGIGVAALPDVPRQYEPWEDHTRSGTFQTVVSNILIIMQISSPHFGHFGLEILFNLSSSHVLFSWYWPAKLRWRKSQFQSVLSWFYQNDYILVPDGYIPVPDLMPQFLMMCQIIDYQR